MTMSASYQDDGPSSGDEAPVVQRKKIGGRQPGATNYSVEEVQCKCPFFQKMEICNFWFHANKPNLISFRLIGSYQENQTIHCCSMG